ncbi:hypothetical protein STEG23_010455, partial [Scotinomys teguina]
MIRHQGNENQNYFEISSDTRQNGSDPITQVTAHAGKVVEEWEHSSFAGGTANLYSHYGNHYGSSSENRELIYLKIQRTGMMDNPELNGSPVLWLLSPNTQMYPPQSRSERKQFAPSVIKTAIRDGTGVPRFASYNTPSNRVVSTIVWVDSEVLYRGQDRKRMLIITSELRAKTLHCGYLDTLVPVLLPYPTPGSSSSFQASIVTPDYMLRFKGSDLGAIREGQKKAFVFPGLAFTPTSGSRTALPGAGARDPATKLGALFVRDFPRVYLLDCQTHTSNTGYFN